ncbi:MAG: diacylglycerol kinase family protein [Candidatus Uhrbacteria bacterium]
MRRTRLSLIRNHRAGRHTRRAGLGRVIGDILTRPPSPQRVYDPETLEELEQQALKIHRDRPDILAIAGGDGTIHRALTAVLRHHEKEAALPDLLVLPIGTMNNAAASFGCTKYPPVELAKRVAAKIEQGIPFDYVHAYPLQVNDEYGFLYGSALPVHLLERYYEGGSTTGVFRSLQVVLKAVLDEVIGLLPRQTSHQLLTKPVRAKFILPNGFDDARAHEFVPYTGLMVAAIENVFVGCRALPEARAIPGRFMLRATQLSFWGVIANLIRIWNGFSIPATLDAVVPELVVEYDQPTVTTIDGDLNPPTMRDVIRCGPMMKVIVG